MNLRDDRLALACLVAGLGLSVVAMAAATSQGASMYTGPRGGAVFQRACAACHGEATGNPVVRLPRPFEYDAETVRGIVREGRGEMPAFSSGQLTDPEIDAVAAFLASGAPR
jgi:mono/diheme cytochrome c family protein